MREWCSGVRWRMGIEGDYRWLECRWVEVEEEWEEEWEEEKEWI